MIRKNDIPNDTVDYSKIQNISGDNVFLGNNAGAGKPVKELSASEASTIIGGELLLDEDDMASDSDTKGATQQSIKAYVDNSVVDPDVVLLSTQTASSSASIDFTGLSSTYHTYEIRFSNVKAATNGAYLGMRTSTDGGSSYNSGASDYITQGHLHVGGTDGSASFTGSYIRVSQAGMGNSTNDFSCGSIKIFDPSASQYTRSLFECSFVNTLGNMSVNHSGAYRASTTAVNAVRILFDTGNITSGTFKLYGYK